jgi:hypothetical protein
MTVIPVTTPAAHLRRDRLTRRLALRGILLLAITELLALALRGTEFLASG